MSGPLGPLDAETVECIEEAINTTNISTDPWKYVACFFGPQTQPLEVTISITVINAIIFITGLLGNLAVCIIIIKHPTLQNATNYYLLNLSISDVTLLLFGLPNDVALYWHQYPWPLGETFCKVRALISETASYVSVLTVVAFSTERYIAICHPLHLRAMSGLQRAIWIITGLWIVSFFLAVPFALYTGVLYITYPQNSTNYLKESALCAMISQPEHIPLTELSTIIFFIIPMIIIAVLYTFMGISISGTAPNTLGKRINGSVHRTSKKTQSNRSVIRMLSFVVLGFFVCWAPFHAQRLLSTYFRENKYFENINYWMYCITGLFYYFSSTLNPILYNVMSDRMRNAFREIFFGIKPKRTFDRRFNSTVRETSHTYVSAQNSINTNSNGLNDDESLQLVRKEDTLILISQKTKSKYIIPKYCDAKSYDYIGKKSNESCI